MFKPVSWSISVVLETADIAATEIRMLVSLEYLLCLEKQEKNTNISSKSSEQSGLGKSTEKTSQRPQQRTGIMFARAISSEVSIFYKLKLHII
jgi:hypothetical protein